MANSVDSTAQFEETTAAQLQLASCHTCGLVSQLPSTGHGARCPRCRSPLHSRLPNSLQRTWAFLIAAILLYIPANVLPIMLVTSLGNTRSDTIFSGVEYLLLHGMWPLALIVFVASMLVPIAKIVILAYLAVSAGRRSPHRRQDRTRLYRLTEFVGRWSMVDVFVVTVLVALVHLRNLAQIQAGVDLLRRAEGDLEVIHPPLAAESVPLGDVEHD